MWTRIADEPPFMAIPYLDTSPMRPHPDTSPQRPLSKISQFSASSNVQVPPEAYRHPANLTKHARLTYELQLSFASPTKNSVQTALARPAPPNSHPPRTSSIPQIHCPGAHECTVPAYSEKPAHTYSTPTSAGALPAAPRRGCLAPLASLLAWLQPSALARPALAAQAACGIPPPPPAYTPAELDALIARWAATNPGHPSGDQNRDITELVACVRAGAAARAECDTLYATLAHRRRMDAWAERLAGTAGIEAFVPPPARALAPAARAVLKGCSGAWMDAVMPVPPRGALEVRYRKPKYWLVSVAAACGIGSEELDARMEAWLRENGALEDG